MFNWFSCIASVQYVNVTTEFLRNIFFFTKLCVVKCINNNSISTQCTQTWQQADIYSPFNGFHIFIMYKSVNEKSYRNYIFLNVCHFNNYTLWNVPSHITSYSCKFCEWFLFMVPINYKNFRNWIENWLCCALIAYLLK